jgi:ABC-type amino acid transport substrate-binding protein
LPIHSVLRFALSASLALALGDTVCAAPSPADGASTPSALRVCADPHNLPFSDEKGEGFENKIAELLGQDLSLPVEYFWFPQVIGFVRVGLNGGHCDLVIGTVVGDELMQTTAPYYRTGYVFVFRRDKPVRLSRRSRAEGFAYRRRQRHAAFQSSRAPWSHGEGEAL